ncbi:family S53 protease-like protein [Fomes fomentarius]|nr:family S53 protease-like protein [Fomes fomentarius]
MLEDYKVSNASGVSCCLKEPINDLVVHEACNVLPIGFSLVGPAAPHTPLTQSNLDAIVDVLYSVSDLKSDKYGQYLSKAQVEQLVAPSPVSISAVNAWLQKQGLSATPISPAGDWLEIQVNVSKADSLLGAKFSKFAHVGSGLQTVRTLSYSIPAALKGHIDVIHPTTMYVPLTETCLDVMTMCCVSFPEPDSGTMKKHSIHDALIPRSLSSKCAEGTTPACLQQLYHIPKTPAQNTSNKLAITGWYGNNTHYKWLQEFLQKYRPDMDPSTNFTLTLLDGGNNNQDVPSVSEGELDIQYTVGLTTKVPVDYVMVGLKWKDDGLNGFLDEVNHLLSLDNPPQVLMTSYGYAETSMPFNLTDKLCKAYAQLGARGILVFFASGNSDVGCTTSNGTFTPMFPSNCPYVTSVSGTVRFAPEEPWDSSSGGFSNYYPAPSYQSSAVSTYLSKINTTQLAKAMKGKYNPKGHAFLDVAAKADSFIVWESQAASLWGMSALSPMFASIIALINDQLAQKGHLPLGFLNLWLYNAGKDGLNDITWGNHLLKCNGETAGFEAVEGWDPVSVYLVSV